MRTRPGIKQVNWWIPEDVLSDLKEYQHEHRLDNLKDAALKLLRKGLERQTEREEG